MNAEPRTEFTEEEIVAFVCGSGSESIEASIERALDVDEDLAAQVAFLRVLMPKAQLEAPPEKRISDVREESLDTVRAVNEEDTMAHRQAAESTDDMEDGELPEDLRGIAMLARQGLTPKQVAERIGSTQTLVGLKLHRIRMLRSKNRG